MRLSTLENELLRPWHFLGLALSSTLSRRTEEVLIKFTVGHFASPSDWLPSILSFLPLPTSSAFLFLPPPLFFILVTTLFPLSLSFSLSLSLSLSFLSVFNPCEGNESGNKSGNENGNVSGNGHASRHFPRKEIGDRRFFFFHHSPHSSFFHPRRTFDAFVCVLLNWNESRILRKLHRAPILFKQIIWISRDPPGILDILGHNFYSKYDSYYSNDFVYTNSYFQSSNRKKSKERSTSIYERARHFSRFAQILQLIYQLISSTSEIISTSSIRKLHSKPSPSSSKNFTVLATPMNADISAKGQACRRFRG